MSGPTEKQIETLRLVQRLRIALGHAPTVRDLSFGLRVRSTSTVHARLHALHQKGLVSGSGRSLELTQAGIDAIGGTDDSGA